MIKTAFVGFEHPHMTGLYSDVKNNSLFSVAGAYEPDEKTRRAAEEKGVIFDGCGSIDDFLGNTRADVIAVGSHFAARGEIVIRALKAGMHVICDKPLCTGEAELNEIRKIACEQNLAVCLLLSLRKSGSIIAALNAVKNGITGRINNIVFEGEHPLNYGKRAGWYFEEGKHGGVINDIAVHGIDLVRQFTCSDVEKVIGAREWNFYAVQAPRFYDSAQFVLKMKNGAGVAADVSYSAPSDYGYSHPSYWHFRLFGEKGLLDFREGSDDIVFYPAKGEIIRIEPAPAETDMLTEFAGVISDGAKIPEYNSGFFEATAQTLMIQKHADMSEH